MKELIFDTIAVRAREIWHRYFRGVAVSVLIALAAAFLSEHYGAPAMFLAILIGLALPSCRMIPIPLLASSSRPAAFFGSGLLYSESA